MENAPWKPDKQAALALIHGKCNDTISSMILYCQLDFPEELGTGVGYSIAHFGCAEVCVAMCLANIFGKLTDPHKLNADLINKGGYAENGAGVVDLIKWADINKIYPDISLLFNKQYYNPPAGEGLPADLPLLDAQLSLGFSVIVGVSFNHSPKEPVPTHYVEIYRKNSDGSYQCRDPWFKDGDHNFDSNYAVNGMNAAQCILQMVCYTGILPIAAASEQKTADLVSALAQGTAVQINEDTKPETIQVTATLEAVKEPTITIPQADYETLKTSNNLYQAMSSAGYPTIGAIDNLKANVLKEMQAVKTDAEEKVKGAQFQHEKDFQTIHDLEEELLNTNREAEVASQSATEFYGKKSVAISRTIELEDKVKQLEDDLKTFISASGIPTPSTKSIAGIVKYFAGLRFAAEKVFQPIGKDKQNDTGNTLLRSFGFKALIAFTLIGIPVAFVFIRQVMAMMK